MRASISGDPACLHREQRGEGLVLQRCIPHSAGKGIEYST